MRLALPLTALLLAGCLSAGPVPGAEVGASPGVVPYEAWEDGLSEEAFTDIVREVAGVAAADGTELSLTVYRPVDAGDAKLPTLLQITPYQTLSRGIELAGFAAWDFWPRRGVVYVEADARGTHSSGGCLDFGGAKDRADAVAFAEWVRAQPWSDGRILVEGVSHPGMGVLVAEVAQIPGMVAGFAHAPVSSYYMDEWMNGARFEGQANGPAYQAIEMLPTLDPSPRSLAGQAGGTCAADTLVKFGTGDGTMTPWFVDKDLNRLAPASKAPLVLTIGFLDMNVFPNHVEEFWKRARTAGGGSAAASEASGGAAGEPLGGSPGDLDMRLVYGYWTHGYPEFEDYRIPEWLDLQHRWIDEVLLGKDTGAAREPRVVVEDSTGAFHELTDWPPPSAVATTLWPTPEGALTTVAPADGEASWIDDPTAERDRWPAGAHALFETEPFAEAVWVAGAPNVTLVATSSADLTKYVVYLFDVAPDGTRTRVTHGFHDSRFPNGLEQAAPPAKGEAATYGFELLPTAHVVEAGHSLALLLASSDNTQRGARYMTCVETPRGGCYDPSGIEPSPFVNAQNTASLGLAGTRIVVPLADPAEGLTS